MSALSDMVQVSPSHAIILGDDIACDGFYDSCKVRIQTHAHDDHLKGFNSSKKTQEIFLTKETRALMSVRKEFYGVGMVCSNIHEIEPGEKFIFMDQKIELLHSNHILGGVQVCVELLNGTRVGYSSDFDWPLDEIIQVDALVIDSTGGHPNKVLEYTQGEAEAALIEITKEAILHGPVDIYGSQRGIVQRAMQVLSPMLPPDTFFICNEQLEKENNVYRKYGYTIRPTVDIATPEGREIIRDRGRYIRFRGKSDKKSIGGDRKTKITLSPFPNPTENPVTVWSSTWPERSYTVGLYDHADFNGTIEYVRNTGAEYVLTDSKGEHAFELASEIRARLNIDSKHSPHKESIEWGK